MTLYKPFHSSPATFWFKPSLTLLIFIACFFSFPRLQAEVKIPEATKDYFMDWEKSCLKDGLLLPHLELSSNQKRTLLQKVMPNNISKVALGYNSFVGSGECRINQLKTNVFEKDANQNYLVNAEAILFTHTPLKKEILEVLDKKQGHRFEAGLHCLKDFSTRGRQVQTQDLAPLVQETIQKLQGILLGLETWELASGKTVEGTWKEFSSKYLKLSLVDRNKRSKNIKLDDLSDPAQQEVLTRWREELPTYEIKGKAFLLIPHHTLTDIRDPKATFAIEQQGGRGFDLGLKSECSSTLNWDAKRHGLVIPYDFKTVKMSPLESLMITLKFTVAFNKGEKKEIVREWKTRPPKRIKNGSIDLGEWKDAISKAEF